MSVDAQLTMSSATLHGLPISSFLYARSLSDQTSLLSSFSATLPRKSRRKTDLPVPSSCTLWLRSFTMCLT